MAIRETIPFNFDDIEQYISQKFTDKGYDAEEGSNTMQLVTAMSYLVSMLNANTAVNINELLLPLARKRNMILEDARVLGYEIEHTRSYKYNLAVKFTTLGINIIENYTEFKSDGLTYYYLGEDISVEVLQADLDGEDSGVITSILVTEGKLFRFADPANTDLSLNITTITDADGVQYTQYYVDIPYTNIEEDGLEIYMTYYDEFADFHNQELWTKSKVFMIEKDTILYKEYVRLDNIDIGTPRIYFKIGDVGKDVRVGTIIEINALESSGSKGILSAIPTSSLVAEILSYTLVLEGAEEESNSSIKENAPLFHNTANRVITKNDYISFTERNVKVKYADVWDGSSEYPNISGNIWFSFVPSNISRVFTSDVNNLNYVVSDLANDENWFLDSNIAGSLDSDIAEIFTELDQYKVPTLVFNHRNPVYFDFKYNINIVKYDAVKSKAERNNDIFNIVNNYFRGVDSQATKVADTPVEVFNFVYFQSNLSKRIDAELTDQLGFNIELITSISLGDRHVINEIGVYKDLRFHLAYSFEDIRDSDNIINTSNLPIIDTLNFVNTDALTVDLSSEVIDIDTGINEFDVKLGAVIIGKYRVYDDVARTIEVVLDIITAGGYTLGLSEAEVTAGLVVDIVYPTPNITFARNTIPRLTHVNFT